MKKSIKNNGSFYDDVLFSSLADNTRIAYDKGWSCFQDYCVQAGVNPMAATPDQVTDFFIANGKKISVGTLYLYRSAINRQYVEAHESSPTGHPKVIAVLKGLQRMRGTAPRRVQALREHHILRMLEQCGDSLIGLRNAAVISLGFSAALRRSEICALPWTIFKSFHRAMETIPAGCLCISENRKRTRPGEVSASPCRRVKRIKPIKRLEDWLQSSGIKRGFVFQTMVRGGGLRGRPLHHADIPAC